MGYESKLYIVEKSGIINQDDKTYASVIATYDLCKCPEIRDAFNDAEVTDSYIYRDDGNTRIIVDSYDDELTELSIDSVIAVIEGDISKGENYRRYFPLLAMLRVFKDNAKQWPNIAVLHFGH